MSLVVLSVCAGLAAEQAPLDAEKMKVALRTDTQEEDGFIDAVVDLVNQGKLSRSLVESTFQWARKKERLRFQYFKHGLLKRLSERRR